MNTLGKNLAIEANLVISATKKEQAKLRLSCHPFPMHAGEHHGILWWVGLDIVFFLQMTTMVFWSTLNLTLIESYFIFTLFCIQVTFLAFCIELDLIFTFFCMQVRVCLYTKKLESRPYFLYILNHHIMKSCTNFQTHISIFDQMHHLFSFWSVKGKNGSKMIDNVRFFKIGLILA